MAPPWYVYLVISSRMSPDEYSYNFLFVPKIKTATSTEQRTESSCAFLKRPPLRFRKVTERFLSSFIALISIFLRPILKTIRECGRCVKNKCLSRLVSCLQVEMAVAPVARLGADGR